MKLDSEQHKQMLLELINQATFNGSAVESVFELKKSIENAEIEQANKKG